MTSDLPEALWTYFRYQQQRVVSEGESWNGAWILDALRPAWRIGPVPDALARETRLAIETAIGVDGADQATQTGRMAALLQWLTPRPQLRQEVIVEATLAFAELLPYQVPDCETQVRRFIDRYVSQLRRSWTGLPAAFLVSGQWVSGATTILDGINLTSGGRGWMVRAASKVGDKDQSFRHAPGSGLSQKGWIWMDHQSDKISRPQGQTMLAADAKTADFAYPYAEAAF